MSAHPTDTPEAIARRRADLLAATELRYVTGDRTAWEPCAGTAQPMAEPWLTTDSRGRRVAYGFCGTCGELTGGRWTNATKSKPLPGGVVLARRHKDKRPA